MRNRKSSALKGNLTAASWDSALREYAGAGPQNLWRSFCDQLNRSLLRDWMPQKPMGRILKTDAFDEAFGLGLYPMLSEYATAVHGIDIAPESVNMAAGRHPNFDVRVGDVRSLAFSADSIDLAVSNSTLDHFRTEEEIHQSLQALFRVLKPGGELIISLDNLQNPIIKLRSILPYELLRKLRVVPFFVGKSFNQRGLVGALEKAGFKVLDTRAMMHCPRFLGVALATLLQNCASAKTQQSFLKLLAGFEILSAWPGRYYTGHFVAARALKPIAGAGATP
jgi:SAM-dependent methyltransferase